MKDMNLIDLHIHTNNSDGEFSTKDIINMLKDSNVTTFSITDHDNINSCQEVINENINGLYYIRGIENSALFKNYNMHILGYDINDNCYNMQKIISVIQKSRNSRILEIIKILKDKYNIEFESNTINEVLNRTGTVGKAHVIELLYKYGYGNSNVEIYKKYLKDLKTEINYRTDAEKVIEAIKRDNGIAVLAHPKEIENEYHIDIEMIIKNLINIGLDGIEVYNSLHNLEDIKKYLDIAKKYNLLISGGSDYHGIFTKPNVELGNVSQEKIKIKSLSLVEYIRIRH
jgi:predicted metal-dependent phosphoesterase TrpH